MKFQDAGRRASSPESDGTESDFGGSAFSDPNEGTMVLGEGPDEDDYVQVDVRKERVRKINLKQNSEN